MFGKRKVAALVAEFLGTGILTLLVLSVQRSTIGVPFFVAMIAALTTVAMILAFSQISGSYLNPAITIGLWTARRLSTLRAVLLVAMELLGAWVAYYVYTYFINTHLTPIGGHFSGRILAAEAVGAGILGMVWGAALFNKWSKPQKAAGVGIAVMISMVVASSAGLGLVNPALALGVRAWVWGTYVLGPVIGAIIGINLYGLLFADDSSAFLGAVKSAASRTSASVSKSASKPAAKTASKKAPAKKTARSKK